MGHWFSGGGEEISGHKGLYPLLNILFCLKTGCFLSLSVMKSSRNTKSLIPALLAVVFLFISQFTVAQPPDRDKVPQPPTSATDGDVKVHGGKFFNRNRSFAKKLGGQAGSTEREGKKFRKQKRGSGTLGREAKVFKRHNHFARKEKNTSAKKPRTKKP